MTLEMLPNAISFGIELEMLVSPGDDGEFRNR
jgi:hypothetical protein